MRDREESPGADQVTVREHLTEQEDLAAPTAFPCSGPPRRPLIGHLAEDAMCSMPVERAAAGPVLSYSGRWVLVTGRPLS